MNNEPRHESEYSPRQIEAARRVLIDLGQVLAAFEDCLVVVGGWVPDLLLKDAEEPHVGSIDVDLAPRRRKVDGGALRATSSKNQGPYVSRENSEMTLSSLTRNMGFPGLSEV